MGYPRRESRGPTRPEDTERMRRVKYRYNLVLKRAGKGQGHIELAVFGLRRHLEDAVVALRGGVSLLEAIHINAACRCEHRALVTHQRVTKMENAGTMTALDEGGMMKQITEATNDRNKHIARLRLTVDSPAADRQGGRADLYTRPLDVEETQTAPFPPELSEPPQRGPAKQATVRYEISSEVCKVRQMLDDEENDREV